MNKLLVNRQGDCVIYDTETNSVGSIPYREQVFLNDIYVATEDGQAITTTEVVDYNKGDVILLLYYYDDKSNRIDKVLVSSDLSLRDDTKELFAKLEGNTNEAV